MKKNLIIFAIVLACIYIANVTYSVVGNKKAVSVQGSTATTTNSNSLSATSTNSCSINGYCVPTATSTGSVSATSTAAASPAQSNQTSQKKAVATVPKLIFNSSATLNVRLAATEEDRIHGLSDTLSLPQNEGMLFVFTDDTYPGIWMKDMNYALDIVWFDSTYTIIDIAADVAPDSFPKIFYPRKLARYVLEVNAGYMAKHKIVIGSKAQYKI